MSDFPDLPEPMFPIHEEVIYPAYRTEFDAPYVQTRKLWGGMMKAFTMKWEEKNALPEISYQRLESHFYKNQGLSFNWTHPSTGRVFSVIYDQDKIEAPHVVPGYRGPLSVRVRTASYLVATTTTTTTTTSTTTSSSTTTTTE